MKWNKIKNGLFILIFILSLASCNNGDKDDRGWFAGEEIDNPTSAEEISTSLEDVLVKGEIINKKEVEEFYQKRDNVPAWNHYDTRKSFFQQLQKADEEGLSFVDYHGEKLEQLLNSDLKDEERVLLEIMLTDAFFEYAEDLYYGKIDPNKLHEIFGVKRKEIQFPKLLHGAVVNEKIEQTLDGLKPNHQVYIGLKKSLQEYATLKEKNIAVTSIKEGEVIKPGDADERMPVLVKRLKELDLLADDYIPQDNLYDEKLTSAVTKFQDKSGLAEDGVLGNSTIQLLNMDNEDKYNKILLNLERWRWFPRDLGKHYILINIPDFKLVVVKDGDTVRTHNVIAGSPTNQTPIFSDSLQYIVINPEWNIPTSIKMNEIIPKASKNPSY
ncbi:MAG TPA: peptidoglycan-binding protein, partial [Salinimicrobium sp.]|nr:peptidoglycan-binding protein [Salinimicrobium sp.]